MGHRCVAQNSRDARDAEGRVGGGMHKFVRRPMTGRSPKTGQHLVDAITGDQSTESHLETGSRAPLGSDSEVVVLEQVSEGMRGPCVTFLNDGPTAESFLEREAGALARASQAQEMPRNVGFPRRCRTRVRRAGFAPEDA